MKWILIISILEVLLWTCLSFCFDSDDYLINLNHPELIQYFEIFTYFNYGVILFFIYLFYKNYITISTTTSTKQLMSDILKTRKTVKYYVWYNLGMLVFGLFVGYIIAFAYNPEMDAFKQQINSSAKIMAITIGVLSFFSIALFGLLWLFYRLLYGTLLRRLYANYKELKKIDL